MGNKIPRWLAVSFIIGVSAFTAVSCTEIKTPPQETTIVQSYKRFPVLEYHLIKSPEGRWSRTPDNFRQDLEWLYSHNYYPFNFKDLLNGLAGLPQGKIPVIFTFDDSSSSQFRYLPNGQLDPECAVGIMSVFHDKHPKDWPLRATFFIVIGTNNPDRNIFGQPEFREKKLRQLTEWGMEVASHTYWHDRLNKTRPEMARYSLARSVDTLGKLSGQEIVSLALPMGLYPSDESIFAGKYQKINYDLKLGAEVDGGMQVVPWSKDFKPLHIHRIQTIGSEWKKFFGRN